MSYPPTIIISIRKGKEAKMATYELAANTVVNKVEVKITNPDGSWITHNFPVSTIEEANKSLRVLSAILFEGQSITSNIY
jgi:uncharacterized lipoprotein